MRPRIAVGRFLIRLGKFIESLAVMVMRPDDLVEFGRQMYTRPHNVASWGRPDLVERGLNDAEMALLEHLPSKEGRLLLLGVGGGREAIPLAQMGFNVTGVDFVPGMVELAKENAARHGLAIEGLVQVRIFSRVSWSKLYAAAVRQFQAEEGFSNSRPRRFTTALLIAESPLLSG